MESVFGWKYLGTMLVAVSLIEPGACCLLKREQTGREKQKAAVESSRNCGEDKLVPGMYGTGDRMFDLPHGSFLVK